MQEHQYPNELKYSNTHEWIRLENEEKNIAIVGITEYAQQQLGELVFVDLPDSGLDVAAGDELGVVESVKAVSDIFTPVSGKILEINEDLEEAAGLINSDPFGDGWLYKIQLKDKVEYEELLDRDDYLESIVNGEE